MHRHERFAQVRPGDPGDPRASDDRRLRSDVAAVEAVDRDGLLGLRGKGVKAARGIEHRLDERGVDAGVGDVAEAGPAERIVERGRDLGRTRTPGSRPSRWTTGRAGLIPDAGSGSFRVEGVPGWTAGGSRGYSLYLKGRGLFRTERAAHAGRTVPVLEGSTRIISPRGGIPSRGAPPLRAGSGAGDSFRPSPAARRGPAYLRPGMASSCGMSGCSRLQGWALATKISRLGTYPLGSSRLPA